MAEIELLSCSLVPLYEFRSGQVGSLTIDPNKVQDEKVGYILRDVDDQFRGILETHRKTSN